MAATIKCAVLDDYQQVAGTFADWERLKPSVDVRFFHDMPAGSDELAKRLEAFDIVIAIRERTLFDDQVLSRLPRLKLLVTTGMKNAAIDVAAARRQGVTVCGTRGRVGPAAEIAWALLLSLMRNIPAESANFRGGGDQWQISVGRDLQDRTLGVAGLGKLGQRVAAYGKAFGMNVVGWSRNNSRERCAALGIGYAASLDELLARADVVTLHITLNDETRGLVGARELGLMKPGAVIVNTSRGPLIDEPALIEALKSHRISGAALDVFDAEPLPADHPFRTLPNVVATPHLGYVTEETYATFYPDCVEDIEAWLAGDPVRVLEA